MVIIHYNYQEVIQMPARQTRRSDQEWLQLITECRQSGLSDKAWTELHDIPSSSFYNAVSRLRKNACTIPEPTGTTPMLDLTSNKQDVVQIDILPEDFPEEPASGVHTGKPQIPHLDNSHMIEIVFSGNTVLRVFDSTDLMLLEKVIAVVRRSIC